MTTTLEPLNGLNPNDTHGVLAVEAPTPPPTSALPSPSATTSAGVPDVLSGHECNEAQHTSAAQDPTTPPPGQKSGETHVWGAGRGPILRDPELWILAATLDDLERVRTATDNRYASEGYVQSPIDNAVTENPADYVIPDIGDGFRYADPADPLDPLGPITVVDLPADNP